MSVLTVGNMYPPHHFGGYQLVLRSAAEHVREAPAVALDFLKSSSEDAAPGHIKASLDTRVQRALVESSGHEQLAAVA